MTLAELAAAPAWPRERVRALPGRCRGALLRDWASHVRRGFGDGAVARLREALELPASALPDAPPRKTWYPVSHQLLVTRWVGAELLDGDLLALEPLLFDAAHGAKDRVIEWALATVGVGFVFRQSRRVHGWLYDRGSVDAAVRRGAAELSWTGAELFAEPTWRLLQAFVVRSTIRSLNREVVAIEARDPGPDGFALDVRWR